MRSFHACADNLQMFPEFDPRSEGDCERVLVRFSSCIDAFNEWIIADVAVAKRHAKSGLFLPALYLFCHAIYALDI